MQVTLFKISCDTCRTSLNVRQKSAIGQILACPKCGSMVQVKPPEGWDGDEEPVEPPKKTKPFVKPVPDPNLPETVSKIHGSVVDGLESRPAGQDASGKDSLENKWQGNNDSSQPTPPPPRQEQQPDGPRKEPLLPGEKWNSAKSQQRKKLLIAFSATGAVLVFGVGAIIFAAMQFAGGNDDDSENSSSDVALADDDKKPNKNADVPPAKKEGPAKKEDKDKPSKKLDPDKGNGKVKEKPSKKEEADPTKKETVDPPPKKDPDTDNGDDKSNSKKNTTDDLPPGFEPKDDELAEGMLPDFFRELDEFGTIFEQDEPLLKLREAFEENDLPGNYGLTRFFVSKSLRKTPRPDLALKVPVAGVAFKQATLLEFLDFHYQLTSVPVSVDVTPILLAGIRLDQKFDFVAKEKTTEEVLKELCEQLGLQMIKGRNSLVITIKDRDNLIEKEYPVGDVAPTAQERQKIMDQLLVYINKKTWSQNGGQGILAANDVKQSIVVKHFGWAQVRVEEFLRHVRLRKGIPVVNFNDNFPAGKHRLAAAEDAVAKKVTLLHADPIALSGLFSDLAKNSDLHVFVNWEATGEQLLPSGFLPLAVEDEPFGQFMDELSEATKLVLVWHSRNVVELTTDFGASSNLTFESYDIQESTTRSFDAKKLMGAMRNLLATNQLADFAKAEMGIDLQDQKSIYAVLPQSAHENVRKILKAAETTVE